MTDRTDRTDRADRTDRVVVWGAILYQVQCFCSCMTCNFHASTILLFLVVYQVHDVSDCVYGNVAARFARNGGPDAPV